MKKIEEMIAVMTAYAEGKKIETIIPDSVYGEQWKDDPLPKWNWVLRDYRIKPEPEYRPYVNAEECIGYAKIHGDWIKNKDLETYVRISFIDKNGVLLTNDDVKSFEKLMDNYIWVDDGTPCGVELRKRGTKGNDTML